MLPIILSYSIFLVVAAYFYCVEFRHRINRRTARKDLADAAREFGLKRVFAKGLGTYKGRVDGYAVIITADERTKITIMLKSHSDVWMMRTNWLEKLINGNYMEAIFTEKAAFSFGNRDADRLFHYQYASKGEINTLVRANPLVRLLADLAKKWRWTFLPDLITLAKMWDTLPSK